MPKINLAFDHVWNVGPSREGYQIQEGAGVDGGYWFVKKNGKTTRFRHRADAEEHIDMEISAAEED